MSAIVIIKKYKLVTCMLLLLGGYPLHASAQSHTWEGFTQAWHELILKHHSTPNLSYELRLGHRHSFQANNYTQYMEARLKYLFYNSPSSGLSLFAEAFFRRHHFEVLSQKEQEYRPTVRFGGSLLIGQVQIQNRQRFEWRSFNTLPSQFRYRTDLKIQASHTWSKLEIKPFIQEELFFTSKGYHQNRVLLGLQSKLGAFIPSLQLMLQSAKVSSNWSHELVSILKLTFIF